MKKKGQSISRQTTKQHEEKHEEIHNEPIKQPVVESKPKPKSEPKKEEPIEISEDKVMGTKFTIFPDGICESDSPIPVMNQVIKAYK